MSETAYIDELIRAENQAKSIIEQAQKVRQRKLKQARDAAQAQVQRYRNQKQQQYQGILQKRDDKTFQSNMEKQTAIEIKKNQADFERNKEKVVQMLIDKVLQVDLSIPSSVKDKFIAKK